MPTSEVSINYFEWRIPGVFGNVLAIRYLSVTSFKSPNQPVEQRHDVIDLLQVKIYVHILHQISFSISQSLTEIWCYLHSLEVLSFSLF